MDIFEALHSRRSVRSYTSGPVSPDDRKILLDAAMAAPSAGNARPWQFVVVDDPAVIARVPSLNPYAAMAVKAPLGILICGDTRLERYQGFWVQDCAAATQNLLLAATGLGLATVWTGVYPVEERVAGFKELFALPEEVIPLAYVVVGHTDKSPERLSRFEAEKIHSNSFGSSYSG